MDPQEWAAHEDAHSLREARARLERYQLAGAKKQNGQPFILADLLPPHLAREYMPPKRPESEVFAEFQRLFPDKPVK